MSITAVEARIAEIQARLAPPPASPANSAAFSAALSAAVAQTADGPATPAVASAPAVGWEPRPPAVAGNLRVVNGKVEPPAELRAYGNGKIPAAALTPVGVGEHRLWAPAAESFKQMLADAKAAGVDIGVTDSYRSYEQQVDLARRKGLYSQGGLAATPGTSSHGWGLSVDLDLNSEALAWMRANGARYGFVEDVPREPWHWTFHGTTRS
ncbi:MAG TPA: M15 family metallopeptidase [Egibacteraceae bacterium]|nr:M15 family metallopeptidase [Egibacteraceae bacterium]